jgi:hypothetical protein
VIVEAARSSQGSGQREHFIARFDQQKNSQDEIIKAVFWHTFSRPSPSACGKERDPDVDYQQTQIKYSN